mmetsp:Transcript_21470/g.69104  ORF Transcript_21470/g.69104 Transcript_21470/m.69104 type:complete len:547 (-) Transcript_21470:614-2254(-)
MLEELRLPGASVTVVMLAVASFFNFGYGTGVISGAGPLIERDEKLSTIMDDLLVVATVVGAGVGAGVGGPLADWRGRKIAMLASAVASLFATLWSAAATSVATLVVARGLVGLGIGLSFNTVPLYAAECVPTDVRGVVVDLSDFSTVSGQLLSSLVNGACASTFSSYETAWRCSLGFGCVIALVVCRLAWIVPESPRYLVVQDRLDEARSVLTQLRTTQNRAGGTSSSGGASSGAVEAELSAIKEQVDAEKEARSGSTEEIFATKRVTRALWLGLGLQTLNQLTGINTAMYYGGEILEEAGFGLLASIWFTVALTAVQLLGVGVSLSTIDARGRRFTALRSLAWVIPSLFLLGLAFLLKQTVLVFVFLCAYLFWYGSGLSGVPYVVNSEIYPVLIRGRCYSIGGALFWFENTLVSLGFPLLSKLAGPQYPFWGFGVVGVVGFYFLWYYLPETTNKPLEQIDKFFTAEPYPKPWHLTGFDGLAKTDLALNAGLLGGQDYGDAAAQRPNQSADEASLTSWNGPPHDGDDTDREESVVSDRSTVASAVV